MEQYRAAKMLDHRGWNLILPRGITPSDVDAVVELGGKILMMEYKFGSPYWEDVPTGQRIMYKTFVQLGKGDIVAVACRHRQPDEKQLIDSIKDVLSFQPMVWTPDGIDILCWQPGEEWPNFIKTYFGIEAT